MAFKSCYSKINVPEIVRQRIPKSWYTNSLAYPRAAVNGHPTSAPSAVKKMAPGMLPAYQQPTAIMVVFMAKELGRNAVDDVNIPAANTSVASVKRPVLNPNWRHIALKLCTHMHTHTQHTQILCNKTLSMQFLIRTFPMCNMIYIIH